MLSYFGERRGTKLLKNTCFPPVRQFISAQWPPLPFGNKAQVSGVALAGAFQLLITSL